MGVISPQVGQSRAGAITAGAKLVSGAGGTVATIGANLVDKLIGTALDTVSNGQLVRWVPV